MASSSPMLFVRRHEPVLVAPAKPTPLETKPLSNFDQLMKFHISFMHVFHGNASMGSRDPAMVIKEALSKTLVFYYPLAGRLREPLPQGKLVVECTGEGALFVEADADKDVGILGNELKPPFEEQLIYLVEGSNGILNCPLLFIQVTRFRCGGFTFGFRINHAMADGAGIAQIMKAMAEFTRGAGAPSVMPAWARELLISSTDVPPFPNQAGVANDRAAFVKEDLMPSSEGNDHVVHRCFFFGNEEILALRRHVGLDLQESSWFDVLTAILWRCRTSAMFPENGEMTRLLFPVDIRRYRDSPLQVGYYGNAVPHALAECKAAELCSRPLSYAVELVKKAKSSVKDESIKTIVHHAAKALASPPDLRRAFIISDTSRLGIDEVDFGWGKAAYAGFASVSTGLANVYIQGRNKEGEAGILAYISLPAAAMEKLVSDIENMKQHYSL